MRLRWTLPFVLLASCAGPLEPDPLDRALTRTQSDLFGSARVGRGRDVLRPYFAEWDRRSAELEAKLAAVDGDDAALADLMESARTTRSRGDLWERYEYARLLLAADRVEEATSELEALVRDEPSCAPAQRLFGEIALRERRAGRAVMAFRAEAEARPELASAHYRLGTAFAATGDRENAERSLRQALSLDPRQDAARILLAQTLLARNEYFGAEAILRSGLEPANRSDGEALPRNLAQFYLDQGFHTEVIALLRDGPDLDAGSWLLLGQAHELEGHRTEALTAYRSAISHRGARNQLRDLSAIRERIAYLDGLTDEQLPPTMSVGRLVAVLANSDEPGQRREAASTLAVLAQRASSASAMAHLERALAFDEDDRVRRTALQATTTGPDSLPRLAAVLLGDSRDESAWVRSEACRLLERLRSSRSIPLLIEALADEDEHVLAAARSALRALTQQRLMSRETDLFQPGDREQLIEKWRAWWAERQRAPKSPR